MPATTFLKLDTGVIRNFDVALGDAVTAVSTKPLAVLRRLAARRGWGVAMSMWLRAMLAPGAHARSLVQGNLDRKRIRLPGLFGSAVISVLYGHIKAGQAALLREMLRAELNATEPDVVIIYNGSLYPESVLADVTHDRRRVFVEAGFFPGTLQVDPIGLNAANSVPRNPDFYLNSDEDFAAGGLPDAVSVRVPKAQGAGPVALEPGYVFVPFQVPSDMQVAIHSPWVRDMEMFLDVVIAAANRNTDDVFVIKEHPSFRRSVNGLRPDHARVIFANDNVTSELICNARAVLTLNSAVGIEALLLDRPVITLGRACYNVDGLVFHSETAEALDDALKTSRDWRHNLRLRHQFLGYLWNVYLLRGSYDNLPSDLSKQLNAKTSLSD